MPHPPGCPNGWPAYPEVTQVICRVPSAHFAQAPWYSLPVHLSRFTVRSPRRLATRIFSEAWHQPLRAIRRPHSSSPLGIDGRADLPTRPAYGLEPGRPTPGQPSLLRLPFARTPPRRCRNINLLSIHYAFQPRVRVRLTLGGFTFPRKP